MEEGRLLEGCVAVELQRVGPTGAGPPRPHRYWMYESGHLLFQSMVEANAKCWWDGALVAAARALEYRGYIAPGVLLIAGPDCALAVVRAAFSRNTLRPPPNYAVTLLGDVEGCNVGWVGRTSLTPLPDAVCWAVLELGAAGQPATMESIRSALRAAFPAMEQPSSSALYDTLAHLSATNKVYQTCGGYFVAEPESGRPTESGRSLLLSTSEAVSLLHGEMTTIRDGARTHQAVQTNLADVICGGNKEDKVLYGRRSGPHRLERRHSVKGGATGRRPPTTLRRAGSARLLSADAPQKKLSLLSKFFKWARSKQNSQASIANDSNSSTTSNIQPPPPDWFSPTVTKRRHAATQTAITSAPEAETSIGERAGSTTWETSRVRRRSLSTSRLPRRAVERPTTPTCASPLCTSTPRALSSASSGYNSLPRSVRSRTREPIVKTTVAETGGVVTTIADRTTTRIYLEQSPVRSVITVTNGDDSSIVSSPLVSPPLVSTPPPMPLDKIKFPSTETIQLEEKLILSNSKNEKNLLKNRHDTKAGSLVDVHGELNNTRRPSASLNPLVESISVKNLLKQSTIDKVDNREVKLQFTSIAAQRLLRGVSIASLDSLDKILPSLEKPLATPISDKLSTPDKSTAAERSFHTDLGIV